MLNEEPVNCTNVKSICQIIKDSSNTRYYRWCHKEVERFYNYTKGVAIQQHEETNYNLKEPVILLREEEKEEDCVVKHVGYCQHYVD